MGGVVNLSGRACKFGQCEGNQRLVNNRSRIHGWHLPWHETTAQPNNTQHHHVHRFPFSYSGTWEANLQLSTASQATSLGVALHTGWMDFKRAWLWILRDYLAHPHFQLKLFIRLLFCWFNLTPWIHYSHCYSASPAAPTPSPKRTRLNTLNSKKANTLTRIKH